MLFGALDVFLFLLILLVSWRAARSASDVAKLKAELGNIREMLKEN